MRKLLGKLIGFFCVLVIVTAAFSLVSAIPGDFDDDGLSDSDELSIYHTFPDDPDTDDDRLGDGTEVEYWDSREDVNWYDDSDNDDILNLLDEDSDSDGILDGIEVMVVFRSNVVDIFEVLENGHYIDTGAPDGKLDYVPGSWIAVDEGGIYLSTYNYYCIDNILFDSDFMIVLCYTPDGYPIVADITTSPYVYIINFEGNVQDGTDYSCWRYFLTGDGYGTPETSVLPQPGYEDQETIWLGINPTEIDSDSDYIDDMGEIMVIFRTNIRDGDYVYNDNLDWIATLAQPDVFPVPFINLNTYSWTATAYVPYDPTLIVTHTPENYVVTSHPSYPMDPNFRVVFPGPEEEFNPGYSYYVGEYIITSNPFLDANYNSLTDLYGGQPAVPLPGFKYLEVQLIGTDPLNDDTDGDLLIDGEDPEPLIYNILGDETFDADVVTVDKANGVSVAIDYDGSCEEIPTIVQMTPPVELDDAVVDYFDITLSTSEDFIAIIKFQYDEASLPPGINEEWLRMYYFEVDSWKILLHASFGEDTGVDCENNIIWGRTTHFTPFSGGTNDMDGDTRIDGEELEYESHYFEAQDNLYGMGEAVTDTDAWLLTAVRNQDPSISSDIIQLMLTTDLKDNVYNIYVRGKGSASPVNMLVYDTLTPPHRLSYSHVFGTGYSYWYIANVNIGNEPDRNIVFQTTDSSVHIDRILMAPRFLEQTSTDPWFPDTDGDGLSDRAEVPPLSRWYELENYPWGDQTNVIQDSEASGGLAVKGSYYEPEDPDVDWRHVHIPQSALPDGDYYMYLRGRKIYWGINLYVDNIDSGEEDYRDVPYVGHSFTSAYTYWKTLIDLNNPSYQRIVIESLKHVLDRMILVPSSYSGVPTDPLDADTDNDGRDDGIDVFPLDPSEWSDNDNDGIGDNADPDDDNDGIPDQTTGLVRDFENNNDGQYDVGEYDEFPLDDTEWCDTDSDGTGNNADTDDDNDGLIDSDEELSTAFWYELEDYPWGDQTNVIQDSNAYGGYAVKGSYYEPEDPDVDWRHVHIPQSALTAVGDYYMYLRGRKIYWGINFYVDNIDSGEEDYRDVPYVGHQFTSEYTYWKIVIDLNNPSYQRIVIESLKHVLDRMILVPIVNGYPTDPFKADTDDDGLLDGDEVNNVGTDPLLYDTDGDFRNDGDDEFPLDPAEWVDTDNDGTGNNADTDDDNDGMPDIWENDNDLNPLVNDAGLDPDTDGLTNLEEFNLNTDPQGQAKWAIVIGVGDYSDAQNTLGRGDLPDTDNDGQDIYDLLVDHNGYLPNNVIFLARGGGDNDDGTNPNPTDVDDNTPTRLDVIDALNTIETNADADDKVVFFFAGHGGGTNDESDPANSWGRIDTDNDEFPQPPASPVDDTDECIILYDTELWDDDLVDELNDINSLERLIILDSCQSGGFIDDLDDIANVLVITAASEFEYSMGGYGTPWNGQFTGRFLENIDDGTNSIEAAYNAIPNAITVGGNTQHKQIHDDIPGDVWL